MSDIQAHVPVYNSRFTPLENLPEHYGAFIDWRIGERVRLVSRVDPSLPSISGIIQSETRHHDKGREIEGARGKGRWIREILVDGELSPTAFSEDCIEFLDTNEQEVGYA